MGEFYHAAGSGCSQFAGARRVDASKLLSGLVVEGMAIGLILPWEGVRLAAGEYRSTAVQRLYPVFEIDYKAFVFM